MNLASELAKLGISDPESKARTLLSYMDGLLEKNRYINLTAITEPGEFIEKHYMDSLAACRLDAFAKAERIVDLGTGGGFPGVPLAVCFPEKEFVLMDSLAKRLAVIDELCAGAGITNVSTEHGRAEDLGRRPEYREVFDLCVSRAVADLAVLSEYCLPLVRVGGAFCAYKSYPVDEEHSRAKKAIRLMGGGTPDIPHIVQSDAGKAHCLVVIGKESPAPGKYPRRAGLPSSRPII